jgi:hypothetical protein
MNDTKPTPTDSREVSPETPAAPTDKQESESRKPKPRLDPVRYGDWEKNGRCIDF